MNWFVEPGFFSSQPVQVAMTIGAISAVVSAVVGVFTVVRGQSFAGHALTDVATTGGSVAFYFNFSALFGFLGASVLGAGAMDLIGVERLRGRDVATGVVLGVATGVSALFLYLDTLGSATTGATQQILFGSIFTVESSTIPLVVVMSAIAIGVIAFIYRPLLLSSLSAELAAARGVPLRVVGLLFMVAMAVAVGLASITIGSVLSTALLIGPAAAALRATRSLRGAMVTAVVLGVAATWLGVLLAYDSYYWFPSSQGLPVSFFIVVLIVLAYLGADVVGPRRRARRAGAASFATGA